MMIMEHVKEAQDMKKLQAELITTQTQKKERQDQMEPLQERAAKVIAQVEEAQMNMAQTQAECARMVNDEIAVQVLDALKDKNAQAQTQAAQLTKNFQAIPREINEAHKGQVARDEPHVIVGGMLEAGRIRKKGYFGKKGMKEESDSWKEKEHMCMNGRPNDTRVRVFVTHCNGL